MKTNILFYSIITLLLIGCSSHVVRKIDNKNISSHLVGTWYYKSSDTKSSHLSKEEELSFELDGTFVLIQKNLVNGEIDSDIIDNGSWKIEEDKLNKYYKHIDYNPIYKFKLLSDDQLTLTFITDGSDFKPNVITKLYKKSKK